MASKQKSKKSAGSDKGRSGRGVGSSANRDESGAVDAGRNPNVTGAGETSVNSENQMDRNRGTSMGSERSESETKSRTEPLRDRDFDADEEDEDLMDDVDEDSDRF